MAAESVALTEVRRDRRAAPSRRLVVLAVSLATMLMPVGCSAGSGKRTPSRSTGATSTVAQRGGTARGAQDVPAAGTRSTVGGPVPPGTTATSVTFVSPETAFVLGTAPCVHRPCTAILQTRDRGRSWRGMPAPPEPVSAPLGVGLWGLRFADARRGYAYGNGLWETSNAAASWRRETGPGRLVVAFAAVHDRELVAVTAACRPGNGGCAGRLTLSERRIAARSWRRVATVGPLAFTATIAVHRNVVWALLGQRLFVSTDGGRAFRSHPQPCHDARAITDDGAHAYLLCIGQGFTGHTAKQAYRTSGTESGWMPMGRPPSPGDGGELAAGSDHALGIATASAAVTAFGWGPLHVRTPNRDRGRCWRGMPARLGSLCAPGR
jgi:hypothetical protein